ncbi:insecticidal delta-endotoxin Cry8Ea1 family protein, partial [Bacillus cereus]|uniref:insecticidal delta-endotoxin Cry8Ea1 family protein n=1 Tax=Bacillus cereus TaxID=1396 RepID=UPI000BFADFA8
MKNKSKNKCLKTLTFGLLASNIITFGNQTIALADTNKTVSKEQAQKNDAVKKTNISMIPFAATNGTDTISDLQKVMNEVVKEDNGISDMFIEHTKEKAAQMGIEFDYLEVLKELYTTALDAAAVATGMEGLTFLVPFLNCLFPKKESDVWEQIKPKVQALINEKLDERFTEETLNTLVFKLQGLSKNMTTLSSAINVLNGKGDHPVGILLFAKTDKEKQQEQVQMAVKDVFANINAMSEEFKNSKYAIASLPLYTQLANIHIGLLKDVAEHGDAWGFDKDTQDQYKADLQKAIKTYSNQVYETFNDGLNKMKEKHGRSNCRGNGWNEVNRYVRTMTLTSLDFASQWSSMDVTLYSQPTHLEKTRLIYSDVYIGNFGNHDYDAKTGCQDYEKQLSLYNISYPGELKTLKINKFGTDHLCENHINGIDQEYVGPSYNYWDSQWDTTGLISHKGTRGESLGTASFSADNPLTKKNFPDMIKRISDPGQIPVGHKIVKVISGFRNGSWKGQPFICNDVTAYVPEETHADTTVDGSQIVGMSADKPVGSNKFDSVLEYVNGGNARKASGAGSTLQYEVSSTKAQKVKIRYRVASNTGTF